MTTPEARYTRLRSTAVTVWAIIGGLILLAVVLWLLGRVFSALVPFIIAFVLVFLLNWPVNELAKRGMARGLAVLLCFSVGFLVLGILFTVLLPPASRQIVAFAHAAPNALGGLETMAAQYQSRFSQLAFPSWIVRTFESASMQLSQLAVRIGNGLAAAVVDTGSDVATGFFDVFIALVIAYWALKDLPKLRSEALTLAGPALEDDAEHLISTVTHVVGGYLKGQTIASFVTGTLATIGLAIIGVPYALVLGIITFFFNFVPYVGPFTSGLIAGMVGLFVSPLTGLLAVVVIVVAQNFTDTVVSPRVMSDQVDLHPILVIFSLLVGGTLFGIPGMLFAIPVAATGKGLFVYYYELRTQRQLASEDGALFRGVGGESDDAVDCSAQDSSRAMPDSTKNT